MKQKVYSYILIICVKYPDILLDNSCPFLEFSAISTPVVGEDEFCNGLQPAVRAESGVW